jgi:ribosomal protein S18 acetylase RimI-like enzyme
MNAVLQKTMINKECAAFSTDMHSSFTIRKATIDDAEAIQHITRESFTKYVKDSGLTNTIDALSESLDQILKDIEEKDVYIFLIASKPVGSIRVDILRDGFLRDGSAYISRFGVLPEYQSFGIGGSLLSYVEEILKAKGVKKMMLHTASKHKKLICFYYSRGFYIDSTSKDRGYVRALMVKELV